MLQARNASESCISKSDTRSDGSVLTNLFIRLIYEVYNQVSGPLRKTVKLINQIFDLQAEKSASTYRFLMSNRVLTETTFCHWSTKGGHCPNGNYDVVMRHLLQAVERCRDSLAMVLLCRLIHGYLTRCKRSTSIRRQRRLLRLNATNSFIKALKVFLRCTKLTQLRMVAVGALADVLLLLSLKDRHFCFKLRLGGLLPRFRSHLLHSFQFLPVTLLRLIYASLRSRMLFFV